jgi:predicted NBD/HSP70 family sugar kinase
VRAAAAGIPGPLNPATGTVQSPTILADWVDLDLRSALRARTGLNVSVDNDANLGAIGEQARGSGHSYRDFIYVKASNGIGACLVLGGAVYRGSGGMAGAIGHTQLDPEGLWCRCGNRGCLEALVSVDVVRRQLEPLGIDPLDADDVTHPVARKVFAESGRTVGRVLANLCNALNPQAVVLGGDLSLTGTAFVDGVRDSIERLAQPGASAVATVPARLGRRAELIGTLTAAVAEARSA